LVISGTMRITILRLLIRQYLAPHRMRMLRNIKVERLGVFEKSAEGIIGATNEKKDLCCYF